MSGIQSQNNSTGPSCYSLWCFLFLSCMFVFVYLVCCVGSFVSYSCKDPIPSIFACSFMSLIIIHDLRSPNDETTTWVSFIILGYLKIIPLGLIIDSILSWFLREILYKIIMTCDTNELALIPYYPSSSFYGCFSILGLFYLLFVSFILILISCLSSFCAFIAFRFTFEN